MGFESGYIGKIPVVIPENSTYVQTREMGTKNVELSVADWDAFETSWDFKRHPLI